jgi:ribosomal protein S20
MAKRHKSAMKRMRQEERRHLRNVSVKSALKTYAKRVETLVVRKDAANAETTLRRPCRHSIRPLEKGSFIRTMLLVRKPH